MVFTSNYRKTAFIWTTILFLASVTCTTTTAAEISGNVVDDSNDPIPDVCVNAHDSTCYSNWIEGGMTDASGNYTITGLVDGVDYYISTDVSCDGTQTSYILDEQWDNVSSTDDCNNASPVVPGRTDIDFTLEETGGIISGTISSGGSSITGNNTLGVTVFSGSCNNMQWAGYGSIHDDGTYLTSGIREGTYYLQVEVQGTNYIKEYWADGGSVRDCADMELVTVSAGLPTSGKNFQLEEGGIISGTLSDTSGPILNEGSLGIDIYDAPPCNSPSGPVGYVNVDPSDGTFTTEALAPGDYYLQVASFGTNYISEYWAETASVLNCADAEPITVDASTPNTGKNFQLEEGGTISGTLSDTSGPILNEGSLGIDIYNAPPCNNPSGPIGYTNVDPSNGTFTTEGLVAGDYYLQVATFGTSYISEYWAETASVQDCATAQSITVDASTPNTGKNFQLEEGGTISGTVFKGNGVDPITNSDVYVNILTGTDPCDLQHLQGVMLNQDGTYTSPGLPTGTYYLNTWSNTSNYIDEYYATPSSVGDCSAAASVSVEAGLPTIDKDFQLDEGIQVSGTVYEATGSTPIHESLAVNLFSGDCSNLQFIASTGTNSQDGTYNIVVSQPGDYYLRAEPFFGSTLPYTSEYWAAPTSTLDCASATKITLATGNTYSGKDFQLDSGGAITGTVFQTDGATPLTGANICVDVYYNTPCDNTWDRAGGSCIDNTDGTYTVSGLAPGDYYLFTNTTDSGYLEEWYATPASDENCTNAQQVRVDAGVTTPDIDFQLDMGGTISGTLYDEASGLAITGETDMRVHFFTGEPCGEFEYLGGKNIESDGTYIADGVPDGSYYIRTRANNEYVDEWHTAVNSDIQCSEAASVEINNGNDVTNIDFYLNEGARISGHVYTSDGATPIDALGRDLRVAVYQGDPCNNFTWFGSSKRVGTDGSYQTPALADGTYYLRFKELGSDESDDLHQREWWAEPSSSPGCSDAQAVVVSGILDITGKDFQINLKNKSSWSLFLPAILSGVK